MFSGRKLRFRGALLLLAFGGFSNFALAEVTLNPRFGFKTTSGAVFAGSFSNGVTNLTNDQFDLQVKVTSGAATKHDAMERSLFSAVETLYLPRKTPYAGELTSTIKCQKDFEPFLFRSIVAGRDVPILIGGVTARRLFGACAKEQVASLGAFGVFSDQEGEHLIEFRIFEKHLSKPVSVVAAKGPLQKCAEELLTVKK